MKIVTWLYNCWVIVRESFTHPRKASYLQTDQRGRYEVLERK